ncbi:undecaprenyl pyrophosphate phosphatase UppP [Pseudomonas marginalis]|nr:undecaprenyl pyrophosphate phosphatase UppP [Pseudomonas marginalis]MCP1524714.1 undecaprenyl pyrophosphate phosphatase UppP [Pseudomonas marginalis]MDQ0502775.1 undecaprenyl pyrophosphate phosphatase UppP [Pseudomonas marginalis]
MAELSARHTREVSDMRLRDALIVGIAQIGALIPGVSRSGSTLTAALFLNFKREEAARFSFLLGLPAIALAGLSRRVSAFFAIWGLMKFLERFSTWPFVIYRALLGIFLIVAVSTGLLS